MQKGWRDLMCDLERYTYLSHHSKFHAFWAFPGAQAMLVYRLGHWLYTSPKRGNPLMRLGRGFYLVLYRLVEITTGISLNPLAEIGPGLYIGHFGEIIIGGQVRMGSNCNISQGVTIGGGGRSERHSPEIGNRVYIAPGAKVFGPITIGDDVAIGANAVVTESFPARSVVGGVPAKLISEQGSFDFVNYAHMETDPDRQPSLPQ